jgi:3-oxoacyl-[acyl-carrier protein] reductase
MLQVNLSSVLSLTQHYGPEMSRRNWGRILNISSIFGVVTKEKRAAYSMTKAALNSLTRTSAIEFGPGGVLVNSLAPGFVDTELTRQNNSEAQIEAITTTIPLRRMAQPSEIASVAQFLVSEENSYLSGQTIIVDGGLLAQ